MEAIERAGSTIGEGVSGFIQDPQRVGMAVGAVTALALGIYASK